AICTTGRGPSGNFASQMRQARTSRNRRFSDIQSFPCEWISPASMMLPSGGSRNLRTSGSDLLFLLEELERARPCVGGSLGSMTPVGGIFERVTGTAIDFDVDPFSSDLHTLFERSNLVGRNPPIESAENS